MEDKIDNDDIPQVEDDDEEMEDASDEYREPFMDWNDLD